ncbi:hypothetical protein R3W88_015524 [Solanum pinnatisectum]|uniref:F-box domain-containing protein n=1 Tax=Solanum pinnatisectum TaxID=50273 RepID=A0AAV9KV70_9SOLN|nr:hypothetical protein R3W88_015524 [Solanum pinnatisectum]
MREILSWLPVKSLLRFKCVSKSWDITRDPYFRTKHQSRHEVNSQRFLLLRAKFDIYTSYFHDLYSTSSLSSLDDVQRIDYLSSNWYPSVDILCGSCDGLVLILVLHRHDYLLLWNPSTRESIQLPFPIFGIRNSTFGLGYDPTIDDYKILTIHHEKSQTQCGILALRSGSWRNNVDIKAPHTLKKRSGSCFRDTLSFVHGAFHWIPCCFGVASFNISNEVCTEIPLSEQMYSYLSLSTTENNHVSVLDGMLCFSSACKVGQVEKTFMLWAMKDYGVKESWTQIFKINISHIWYVKPIYRFADGDVLCHCGYYMHEFLSTSKGRFSHPLIQHQDKIEIITFNESLISPKLLI